MKKIIALALALTFGLGFTQKSEAARRGAPLWTCQLGFKGHARGLKIIIGKYKFDGTGELNCISANGKTVSYPVSLTMNSAPISAGVALGSYEVYGQSAEVSLFNTDPRAFFGKYTAVQGHATIVGGLGAITAVKIGEPQLSLTLSINVQKGFGLDATISRLTIAPLHRRSDATPASMDEDSTDVETEMENI